jgi:glycosyltransferase involved in cell wall biosynthesis
MKKKVIFMVINMNIGGTEKALLNMIAEMPDDEYDITILMLEKYGVFLESIPKGVRVEVLKGYEEIKGILNNPPKQTIIEFLKQRKIFLALSILFFSLLSKVSDNRSSLFKHILKDFPNTFKTEYDIAIAYAGPMDFISYFVLNKLKARKKIQWIHFDVTKIGFNKKFASKVYSKFDRICVVSEEAREKIIKNIPIIKEKTEVFHNIVSSELILQQAKNGKGFVDEFNGIRILTVGRLSTEKGQDLAIKALLKLRKDGYNVKWYCLGEGNSRKKYGKLVEENGLEDRFIFLGADPNPYPYVYQCDIYVQPSRYEGYCLTLIEARYLNKPIVTTNVNGAKEQIDRGQTGLIVNINENEIYLAVKRLIDNKALCEKFSRNLMNEKVNTTKPKLLHVL